MVNIVKKRQKPVWLDPKKRSSLGYEFIKFAEKRIKGQPRMIEYGAEIVDLALNASRHRDEGPICVLLLIGTTGAGKTLFSKVLAEFLFDDPRALFRIDGQDFSQRHQIAKLLHSPTGYMGSDNEPFLTQEKLDTPSFEIEQRQFLESISIEQTEIIEKYEKAFLLLYQARESLEKSIKKGVNEGQIEKASNKLKEIHENQQQVIDKLLEIGFPIYSPEEVDYLSVLHIDEIERSHIDFRNLCYRIFDEGMFENSLGDIINFRNSFVVVTSNLGSDEIINRIQLRSGKKVSMGFTSSGAKELSDQGMYEHCKTTAKRFLGGPLFGRIDKTIFARPFTEETLSELFDQEKEMLDVHYSGSKFNDVIVLFLHVSDDVKEIVVKEAMNHHEEGARILIKKFNQYISDPIKRLEASGQIEAGDIVYIVMEKIDGRYTSAFSKVPREKGKQENKTLHLPPSS